MAKKFYTDGVKTIKRDVEAGDIIPEGFTLGRTFHVNTWNKGLTAETDERVRANGEATRATRVANESYVPWNKGLTKETSPILENVGKKISQSTKGRVAHNKGVPASETQKKKQSDAMKGRVPYNKGLTKDTSVSVLSCSKKLLGHECFVKDWELAKQREYETKKRNGTFNTSRPEEELFRSLCNEYGSENVLKQYVDERYPFRCDFYIPSEDLFIEYNGTIEHNGRPYNPELLEDIKELEALTAKAEEKGCNSRYWNIIKWWTEVDPLKLKTLRMNNLNFRVIYPTLTIFK